MTKKQIENFTSAFSMLGIEIKQDDEKAFHVEDNDELEIVSSLESSKILNSTLKSMGLTWKHPHVISGIGLDF